MNLSVQRTRWLSAGPRARSGSAADPVLDAGAVVRVSASRGSSSRVSSRVCPRASSCVCGASRGLPAPSGAADPADEDSCVDHRTEWVRIQQRPASLSYLRHRSVFDAGLPLDSGIFGLGTRGGTCRRGSDFAGRLHPGRRGKTAERRCCAGAPLCLQTSLV